MTRKTDKEIEAMSAKNRAAWPKPNTVARIVTFNNGLPPPARRVAANTKYHSQETEIDGIKFASKKEAYRWRELIALQQAKKIRGLQRQVKFELIPKQVRNDGVAERAVTYTADFTYTDSATGSGIVEDSKGITTQQGVIRRKLMLYIHGISVLET